MPLDLDALRIVALGHATLALIAKHHTLLTQDLLASLGHIVNVGDCAYQGMNQPRIGVHANVCLHGERHIELISRPCKISVTRMNAGDLG